MIDLLSKVLDGRIASNEALDAWPDIDDLTDDKLMQNAWHSLSHYDTDEDIRANEPGYEAQQKATLRAFRDELKSSVGK